MRIKVRKRRREAGFRRLAVTYAVTFVFFFLIVNRIVPHLFPEVNIPALENQDNLATLTSDDFRVSYEEEEDIKGHIDPRLKGIELQEKAPKPVMLRRPNLAGAKTTDKKDETKNNVKVVANAPPVPKLIHVSNNEESKIAPPKLIIPRKERVLNLRNNIVKQVEEENKKVISKVLIGEYKNAKEAKKAIEELTELDETLTPFIRERNGTYYLQVASYEDDFKAEYTADEFEDKGFKVRIIHE